MATRRKFLPVATMLLAACAIISVPNKPPEILPTSILESFCANLIAEHGPIFDREITVPLETVPLIEIFALHILSALDDLTAEDFFADEKLGQELRKTYEPMPIVPPKGPSECHWKTTTSIREAQGRHDLVLEISSPLENPYATDPSRSLGVFARLTSGIIGGTWYWIVIEKRNGEWKVSDVVLLDISEH